MKRSVKITLSLILSILAYYLSIVSEATQDTAVLTSYVTGGFELLFFLVAVPLACSACNKQVSSGLRKISWIMYSVAIPHALLFFNWGIINAGDNRIPNGQIPMNALMFFFAAMLMIADAWKKR